MDQEAYKYTKREDYPPNFNLYDINTWPEDFGTDGDIANAEVVFQVPEPMRSYGAPEPGTPYNPADWKPNEWAAGGKTSAALPTFGQQPDPNADLSADKEPKLSPELLGEGTPGRKAEQPIGRAATPEPEGPNGSPRGD